MFMFSLCVCVFIEYVLECVPQKVSLSFGWLITDTWYIRHMDSR